jgi:antitoxin HicB
MNYHYSIIIQWSEVDRCYVVSLPEWGDLCHTHGETYEEAFQNAHEVLELLVESARKNNESLPEPNLFGKSLQRV